MNAKKKQRCVRALERFTFRERAKDEDKKNYDAYMARKNSELEALKKAAR